MDRRVVVMVRGYNGNPRDPSGFGRSPDWMKPPHISVPKLEQTVRRFANVGARRVMLHLPFGSDGRMIADQFTHMEPARIEAIRQMLDNLERSHPDLEFGVYAGTGIDLDPSTPAFADEWRPPDIDSPTDRKFVLDMYSIPADIGFDFIMLDNISGEGGNGTPVEWMKLIQNHTGLDTYGEAMPTSRSRYTDDHQRTLNAWRWLGLERFITSRGITTDGTRDHYIGLNGHIERWRNGTTLDRKDIITEWINRGFVPAIYTSGRSDDVDLVEHAVRTLEYHDRNPTQRD